MTKVIAFHSFHRGSGTSNLLTSTAALIARDGKRVGIIDTDLQSPSAYVFFGLKNGWTKKTLNDYLWGNAAIEDIVYDVTTRAGGDISGKLFLCPASTEVLKIMRIIREGYELSKLTDCFTEFSRAFNLDYLVIDTSAGIREETLLSLAVSDSVVVILRLDHQAYQGTAVTIDLVNDMENTELIFIINDSPKLYSTEEIYKRVEDAYDLKPYALIPHTNEMLTLASGGIFSISYPDHAVTGTLQRLASELTGNK